MLRMPVALATTDAQSLRAAARIRPGGGLGRCYSLARDGLAIGVDVGGTFTDLAAVDDESGVVRLEKVPTTPADQSIGVAAGLGALLARHGMSPAAGHVSRPRHHGLHQRRPRAQGRAHGLVTTQGIRDLLELAPPDPRRPLDPPGRQARAPGPARPAAAKCRSASLADGSVVTAAGRRAARAAIGALRRGGVEAIAVCFLTRYVEPAHERAVAELLRA